MTWTTDTRARPCDGDTTSNHRDQEVTMAPQPTPGPTTTHDLLDDLDPETVEDLDVTTDDADDVRGGTTFNCPTSH